MNRPLFRPLFRRDEAMDVVDGFLVAILFLLACHAAWPIVVGAWRAIQL